MSIILQKLWLYLIGKGADLRRAQQVDRWEGGALLEMQGISPDGFAFSFYLPRMTMIVVPSLTIMVTLALILGPLEVGMKESQLR